MIHASAVWTRREITAYEGIYSADCFELEGPAPLREAVHTRESPQSPFSQTDSGVTSDLEEDSWSTVSSPIATAIEDTPAPQLRADIEWRLRDPLYEAQLRKLRFMIEKADIQRRHRVLEIGTGTFPAALSVNHHTTLARESIRAAGLEEFITVHLMDYRLAPLQHDPLPLLPIKGSDEKGLSWRHRFDRFVAIEVEEHEAKAFLPTFFRAADECLKPDVFPRAFLPSIAQLVQGLASGTGGALIIDSIVNIGIHHGPTLRIWRERFEEKFDTIGGIRDSLLQLYPELDDAALNVIRRKWTYY
ncbi:hypothetical protein DL93DRAFT_2163117 [Clavulina sp. PMI_390]|nr:hypothetical protein DL93DRAFT_2163117 [Clavulina sp. PMI_390]